VVGRDAGNGRRGSVAVQEYVFWHGALWRVDGIGIYEKLIVVRPEECEPSERWQKSRVKIDRYAQMWREGSDFPPISVSGTTAVDLLYRICNGHHRWLAAKKVSAEAMWAWTCFYRPITLASGRTVWSLARMSDTPEGRDLARFLGRSWCPRCGRFLDYTPGAAMCRACEIS